MRKEQLILGELAQISEDITRLVKDEQVYLLEADLTAEKNKEAGLSLPAIPYPPNRLKEELRYLLARLNSVNDYLSDTSDSMRFLMELARKLTS